MLQYMLKLDMIFTQTSGILMTVLYASIIAFMSNSGERFNREVKKILENADGNDYVRLG